MLQDEIKEYLKMRLDGIYAEIDEDPSQKLMGMVEGVNREVEDVINPLVETIAARRGNLEREAAEIRRLLKELDS